ncbi:hypothetical protein HMPREF0322_01830 [Desulfitobacterium hafniense DP7]|uniref:Uncharacterized protein n=1 Tax=Desulfitobacterium hafniense DP7 TaxID=537010 RepID=G9XLJ4_DESHA|nr:hypothetical protein HMPREF0322_01830 [Desulfitobacterium hafniense DP7]
MKPYQPVFNKKTHPFTFSINLAFLSITGITKIEHMQSIGLRTEAAVLCIIYHFMQNNRLNYSVREG